MARPTNEEKYSSVAQKRMLRELCGDALAKMKSMIRRGEVDFTSLSNFVNKALPIVIDDNTENANNVTMDLLIKKAIKINMRIQEANEEGLKEEEDENPT